MTRSLICSVLLGACAARTHPAPDAPAPEASAVEVAMPPLDDREARYVVLDNGVRAMVVTDPNTDTAAAALAVHVGHYSDPVDRQGLAHFLEHMLFIGTEPYPEPGEYQSFIAANGGRTNAGTGREDTSYHFSVEASALEPALSRFGAFFTAPLLDPAYVDRERNAVHAEYSMKLQDTWRRERQVRKVTTNPDHPQSKFSVGNLDTLADREGSRVHDDLRAFWQTEYAPDLMTLAVTGPQPLDVLEGWVRQYFGGIAGTAAPREERPDPFTADQLGVRVDMVPLREERIAELRFWVPPQAPLWPQRPNTYLSLVLGSEAEGTLSSVLKDRGWSEALSTDLETADDHEVFVIRHTLTADGAAHLDEVVAATFQAIRLVSAELPAHPYTDRARLMELAWSTMQTPSPVRAVQGLAWSLWHFPPEHAVDYWVPHGAFPADAIRERLDLMTPERARLLVVLPGELPDAQVEPLYDVPYTLRPLDDAERAAFRADTELTLRLPPPNPYLPASMALKPGGEDPGIPALVATEPVVLWHLQDTSFGQPGAVLTLRLFSTLPVDRGIEGLVHNALLEQVVEDALASMSQTMSEAGVDLTTVFDDEGGYVKVSGFDEPAIRAMADATAALASVEPDEAQFTLAREALLRRWRNESRQRPSSLASSARSRAYDPDALDRLAAVPRLERVTRDDLLAWRDDLFGSLAPRLMVQGNVTEAESKALAQTLAETFGVDAPATSGLVVRHHTLTGPVVQDIVVDHQDSALAVSWSSTDHGALAHARHQLLAGLLAPEFFRQLRTEDQLGYSVNLRYSREGLAPAVEVSIQSTVADPQALLDRVDQFLDDAGPLLSDMAEEQLESTRQGLITRVLEPPRDLEEANARLRPQLYYGVEGFDWDAQLAEALSAVTRDELLALHRQLVAEGAPRVVVRGWGTAHADARDDTADCADTPCTRERMGPIETRPILWELSAE